MQNTESASRHDLTVLSERVKCCNELDQRLSALESCLLKLDPVKLIKCYAAAVDTCSVQLIEQANQAPTYRELRVHLKQLLTVLDTLLCTGEISKTRDQLRSVLLILDACESASPDNADRLEFIISTMTEHLSRAEVEAFFEAKCLANASKESADLLRDEASNTMVEKLTRCVPSLIKQLTTGLDTFSNTVLTGITALDRFVKYITGARGVVHTVSGILMEAQQVNSNAATLDLPGAAKQLALFISTYKLNDLLTKQPMEPTTSTHDLGLEPLFREVRKIQTVVDSVAHAVSQALRVLSSVQSAMSEVQLTLDKLLTIVRSTPMQTSHPKQGTISAVRGTHLNLTQDLQTNISDIMTKLRKILPGSWGSPATIQMDQVMCFLLC